MKKLVTILLSLTFVLGAFALVGCEQKNPVDPVGPVDPVDPVDSVELLTGTLTVVVNDKAEQELVYTVDLAAGEFTAESRGADVLAYLAATTDFYYEGKNSKYGLYLTAMGTYDEETYTYSAVLQEDLFTWQYLYIYTTVAADQDTSDWKSSVDYNGTTLIDSAVGISSMTIEDGAILYFTYY